jgi:hypothetical protein
MKARNKMTPKNNTFQIQQRGCGWPIAGGTYMYVPTGANGTPIWNFLIDPTVPIEDPDFIGDLHIGMVLKYRGCKNAEGKEIFDIFDYIGSKFYPNPSDWIMEVSHLGFHQKFNPNDLTHLVPESMYFGIHARASFVDPTNAYDERIVHPNYPKCPANHPQHVEYGPGNKLELGTYPGLFFSNIINGEAPANSSNPREVIRKMPAFEYSGYSPVGGEGETIPAIFFKMPIGRIGRILVYADADMNTHEKALETLEKLDQSMQRVSLITLGDKS